VENGKTGTVCEPTQDNALRDAILLLDKNPKLRVEIAEQGFQFAHENFSWGICANRYIHLFQIN
jgi:glycosyltransferase involved in cell wall biosynthesis